MVPPFLAYAAIVKRDLSLIKEAVRQCQLYADILVSPTSSGSQGLWRHIAGAENEDPGFWSTSNGWAAAGMVRVVKTTFHYNKIWPMQDLSPERKSLVTLIKGILDCAIEDSKEDGLLRNYLDDPTWFADNAGTALLASVVYRMAPESRVFSLTADKKYVEWADASREAVLRHVDPATGEVAPVVNALKHDDRIPLPGGSSEAQSFVVLMEAAYRDYHNGRSR